MIPAGKDIKRTDVVAVPEQDALRVVVGRGWVLDLDHSVGTTLDKEPGGARDVRAASESESIDKPLAVANDLIIKDWGFL